MSEKPILFTSPMVRASMRDVDPKTQTRRVITTLRRHGRITEFGRSDTSGYDWHFRDKALRWHDISHARLLELAPYQAGDILWVRETCANIALSGYEPTYFYRADGDELPPYDARAADNRWRPSIFMPRSAARLFLRVTAVRVERVQDISEDDCYAEGTLEWADAQDLRHNDGTPAKWPSVRHAFEALWGSINAKRGYGWDANPWVWVYEFERCEERRKAARCST